MGLIGAVALLAVGFFAGVLGEMALGKPVASLLAEGRWRANIDMVSSSGVSQLLGFLLVAAIAAVGLAFFAWRLPRGLQLLIISALCGAVANAVFDWPPASLFRGLV